MPETTDDPILLLIRDKATQRRGFDLLVRTYSGKVYDLVRRMLIDHDDSNDVVQEIFFRIWQNLDRFRGESSLFTWIYRISVNEALAFLRKKQMVNWLRFESYEKVLAGRLLADPWFDGDRAEARLQQAILTLPRRQRLVFELRYHQQLKYPEIAAITGTSVGALKASYHHAMEKIEKILKEE